MLASARLSLAVFCLLLLAACSSTRPLPPFERPLARAAVQPVRTTAYTDTETDHRPYGCRSALGSTLACGPVNSAAADWSRWPAGTVFRIRETGETYRVDDYGWALAGTNTIDLYKPSRAAMNAWGVHHVQIEILQWGDVWQSYDVLKPRSGYAHIRRMLKEIDQRYARGSSTAQPVVTAAVLVDHSPLSGQAFAANPPPSSNSGVPRAVATAAGTTYVASPPAALPVRASVAPASVAANPFFR